MTVKHDPPLVLIADDQVPTTILLERVFEHEGYQVKSVYDGISAVEAAQTLFPDIILLDVQMPGMTGFEVLKELREKPSTASIPTILITAMGDLANVVQGLKLGADDYLRKPFQPQELLARAQSKMRARKLEETLQRRTQELEALLRVSEELSQQLTMEDLLEFILFLTLDLLPGSSAAIYQLDEDGKNVKASCIKTKGDADIKIDFDDKIVNDHLKNTSEALLWDENDPIISHYLNGMLLPLQYGGSTHGLMIIVDNAVVYDESHLRLFSGVGKQATLALRNAELWEIQANYALHLEDMVSERTSELESAQQMLVRSEKLASVGRLAASIAHEINNPLLPIQINLEHMLEDIQDGHPIASEEIERTQESVERIGRIVSRLLEFAGKGQSLGDKTQTVDINKILEGIISLNKKFFAQDDIEIIYQPTTLPTIEGNKDQLEQVFMNIALNAKVAMKPGGKLTIKTSTEKSKLHVAMTDTGHGIPENMIDTIFEPFVSTKEDGSGLGLFVSYGIINNHNGNIQVESELGKGTTFTVQLPIV